MPEQFTQGPSILQSDIVNNLISTSTTKPLSAAQGKVLKDNLDNVAGTGKSWIANADMNTYTTPGIYYLSTGITMGNDSFGLSYVILEVISGRDDTLVQIIHYGAGDGNPSYFTRQYRNNVWSSVIDPVNALNTKINPLIGAVAPRGVVVVDCNNVTGSSIIRTASESTNTPTVGTSGVLLTFVALDNVLTQIYMYYDGTPYVRTNWYGAWTAWQLLALNSNMPKTVSLSIPSAVNNTDGYAYWPISSFNVSDISKIKNITATIKVSGNATSNKGVGWDNNYFFIFVEKGGSISRNDVTAEATIFFT